eukprot:GGOE01001358.1.p1 GENE.GGOE01001358.1~~GGOE01001358.1.p1  ORF type:complete len:1009 (+),score=94.94 GGOE01001358.1:338-3028(+)
MGGSLDVQPIDCRGHSPQRPVLSMMCPVLRDVFCCGCRYLSTLQLIFYDSSAFYRISSPLFSLSWVLESDHFLRLNSRCPGSQQPEPEESSSAHDPVEALPVPSTSSSSGPSKPTAKGAAIPPNQSMASPSEPQGETLEPLNLSPHPSLMDYPSSPLSSSTSTRQIVSASSSSKESASDTETGSSCQPQSIPSDSDEDFVVPKRRVGTQTGLGGRGCHPNILVTDATSKRQSGLPGSKTLVSLGIQHCRTPSSSTTASSLGGAASHRHSTSASYKNRSELAETVEMLNWAKPLDHLLEHHFKDTCSHPTTCSVAPRPGLWARQLVFRATLWWLMGLHLMASCGLAVLRLLQRPFGTSANICGMSFTARQLETKGHEFSNAHHAFELLFKPPKSTGTHNGLGQPCEQSCHPGATQHITLSYLNWLARQGLDHALGCTSAFLAWSFAHELYCHLRLPVEYVTQDMPEAYLDWFLGWPAGFKANDQLNPVLGYSSLALMMAWRGLMLHIQPWWPAIIRVVGLSGLLGLTTLISVIADLVVFGSIHLHFLYWCFAKICVVQLSILDSLGKLFRGKKYNPLRKRVDSAAFGLEQLLLGTVWFTLLIFIFPTVAVYYLFFAAVKLLILVVQEALNLTVLTINAMPIFLLVAFVLQTCQSHPIPDGVFFEFLSLRAPSRPDPIAGPAPSWLAGFWGSAMTACSGIWRRRGQHWSAASASSAHPTAAASPAPSSVTGAGPARHHSPSRTYCLGSFRPLEVESHLPRQASLAFDQVSDSYLRQPSYCFAFRSQPLRLKEVFREYIAALRTLWKQHECDLFLLLSYARGAHARLSPFPVLDQSARLAMETASPGAVQPPDSTTSLSSKGPLERQSGRTWLAGSVADGALRRKPRRLGKSSPDHRDT